MDRLRDQVAIVTGASSGIGAAAARCFAKQGAQVVLAARREDALRTVADELTKRGGGSIIFTSTFVGYTAEMPNMAAYAASKAGLIGLTRALAVELAPARVRVNALIPGGVDTPMGRAVASTDEALRQVESLHALGRIARPEELAQSALFLASAASSFTTGSALVVDGGVSVQRG
ncbi:MAG: hypothetical protein Tsb0020_14960 [Haliangiales bacterium]